MLQGFSWSDAQFLPIAFPSLQRLHLCRNRIETFPIPHDHLQRWSGLQLLIIENNLVGSWSGIAALAPLPSLVRLSLCGNPVSGHQTLLSHLSMRASIIAICCDSRPSDFTLSESSGFSSLASLGLSECRITRCRCFAFKYVARSHLLLLQLDDHQYFE